MAGDGMSADSSCVGSLRCAKKSPVRSRGLDVQVGKRVLPELEGGAHNSAAEGGDPPMSPAWDFGHEPVRMEPVQEPADLSAPCFRILAERKDRRDKPRKTPEHDRQPPRGSRIGVGNESNRDSRKR